MSEKTENDKAVRLTQKHIRERERERERKRPHEISERNREKERNFDRKDRQYLYKYDLRSLSIEKKNRLICFPNFDIKT